jgi:hypothetical protein
VCANIQKNSAKKIIALVAATKRDYLYSLVKQWNLTKDDYLDWSWEIHKGED